MSLWCSRRLPPKSFPRRRIGRAQLHLLDPGGDEPTVVVSITTLRRPAPPSAAPGPPDRRARRRWPSRGSRQGPRARPTSGCGRLPTARRCRSGPGTHTGRRMSRSCSGHTRVTGQRMRSRPSKRPARMASLTADEVRGASRRRPPGGGPPAAARGVGGRRLRRAARARPGRVAANQPAAGSQPPGQAVGDGGLGHQRLGPQAGRARSRVTLAAAPLSPSSSATQPPSELPATCGRSRPIDAR